MPPPYDESLVLATCEKVRALYRDASREPDEFYPVWVARTVYDYATGSLSYPASEAKHLAECRAALGLVTPLPPPGALRPGSVRLDGRAFVDDAGPWLALGASYFPLVWMVRHDRDRAEANLRWLAARGVDCVRVFAEVGGLTWADRTVDPDDPNWDIDLFAAADLAASCGLRIAWTLFAGPFMAHDATWYRTTRRFARIVAAERALTQYVEVRNEGEGCDDATMRACAQILRDTCPDLPVALCGTPETGLPDLYRGSAATLATVHYDRTYTERGWRPVRQPWGYYDLAGMPAAHVNSEPIGIDSSVASESDPVRLAGAALTSWVSGEAGYVLHHGAGIRAGGAADLARGRSANVWEQPTLDRALSLIATARLGLPLDLANWDRHGHAWPTHPLVIETAVGDAVEAGANGCNRCYAATRGHHAVVVVAGIRGRFVAHTRAAGGPEWNIDLPSGDRWVRYASTAGKIAIDEGSDAAPLAILTRGIA